MSLIDTVRTKADELKNKRDAAVAEIASIIDAVETDERSDLTDAESAKVTELRESLTALDGDIAAAEARLAELDEIEGRRAEAAKRSKEIAPARPASIRVGTEERTYRADGEHDFIADAWKSQRGDRAAADRVERARAEALVDYRSTTGNFGGLVVPQYLVNQFAPVLKSGRPFLSNVNTIPLPAEGMTITIPRGNQGTTVAAQQTQNTSVNNVTYTESDLTVSVRTFAGQNVVSRQAVERGAGIAQIILGDLLADYATQVNVSAINGPAASVGGHVGILNETSVQTAAWTGTTGASLVSSLHNAIGKINASRYQAADLIVMHPRRWAWLCAQSDTAGRPLVQIDGPGFNAQGNGGAAGYGVVGSVAGISVVTDAGVPTTLGAATNEDRIIVTRRNDILFMEDAGAPVGLTFEEVLGDQLTVRMVTYGFSAFTAGRYPVATCAIQGTGFTQVLS